MSSVFAPPCEGFYDFLKEKLIICVLTNEKFCDILNNI
jgi:hypothetical protein